MAPMRRAGTQTEPGAPRDWTSRLFAPVDIASLVVFRILLGAILFWEVWRYFDNDWIRLYYVVRQVHFKYYGFEWVQAWPGEWMYAHFVLVGFLSLCVMLGFLYRVSAVLLFLSCAYWFLLDETRYLNHLYLTLLLCFLMIFVPAHRARSIDAWGRPDFASDTAPAWSLWLLRAQIGIVYFYAGIAKLDADWLRGAPLADWLAKRSSLPLIGRFLDEPAAVSFFVYGGLLFDLLVVPLLLWKRTRVLAFSAAVFFHVVNKWLFDIGIFPALGISATLLFLSPGWPRRLCLLFAPADAPSAGAPRCAVSPLARKLTVYGCGAWLAVQLLVPLRHFLYPGNVHWTEEGHRFSWHMKLRDKQPVSTRFFATNPETGHTWEIDQTEYLSSRQRAQVGTWPDMAQQFAGFVAEELERRGEGPVAVRVEARVSLNGRNPQLLIDPDVDLSSVPRTLLPAGWIEPLTEPLP